VRTDGDADEPITVHTWDEGVRPSGLAADEQRVYWADQTAILGALHGQSDATKIADVSAPPKQIAVAATGLYWIDATRLLTISSTGGAPILLYEGPPGSAMAQLTLDEQSVFFVQRQTPASAYMFYRKPLGGGEDAAIQRTLQFDAEKRIVTDGSFLYWIAYNTVRKVTR
jgi:hypothetical protein